MKKKRAVAGGLLLVLGIAQSVSAGTTTVTYHVDPSYVLSGMATSPEDLARLMVEAMPAKLADLFASFGILTE